MLYHNVRVGAHAASVVDALVFMGATALTLNGGAAQGWWAQPPDEALRWFGLAFVLAFLVLADRFRIYHPWRTERLKPELIFLFLGWRTHSRSS